MIREWGDKKEEKKNSNNETLTPWEYTSHLRACKEKL